MQLTVRTSQVSEGFLYFLKLLFFAFILCFKDGYLLSFVNYICTIYHLRLCQPILDILQLVLFGIYLSMNGICNDISLPPTRKHTLCFVDGVCSILIIRSDKPIEIINKGISFLILEWWCSIVLVYFFDVIHSINGWKNTAGNLLILFFSIVLIC